MLLFFCQKLLFPGFSCVFGLNNGKSTVNITFFTANRPIYRQIGPYKRFMGPQPGTERVIRAVMSGIGLGIGANRWDQLEYSQIKPISSGIWDQMKRLDLTYVHIHLHQPRSRVFYYWGLGIIMNR